MYSSDILRLYSALKVLWSTNILLQELQQITWTAFTARRHSFYPPYPEQSSLKWIEVLHKWNLSAWEAEAGGSSWTQDRLSSMASCSWTSHPPPQPDNRLQCLESWMDLMRICLENARNTEEKCPNTHCPFFSLLYHSVCLELTWVIPCVLANGCPDMCGGPNQLESVLSLNHVGPWDWIQVIWLGSQHPYMLSHLTSF